MKVNQNRKKLTNRYRSEERRVKIKNKIANILDAVCLDDCPQNFKNVCRAFQQPLSNAEQVQRSKLTVSGVKRNCLDQAVIDKHYDKLKKKKSPNTKWTVKT